MPSVPYSCSLSVWWSQSRRVCSASTWRVDSNAAVTLCWDTSPEQPYHLPPHQSHHLSYWAGAQTLFWAQAVPAASGEARLGFRQLVPDIAPAMRSTRSFFPPKGSDLHGYQYQGWLGGWHPSLLSINIAYACRPKSFQDQHVLKKTGLVISWTYLQQQMWPAMEPAITKDAHLPVGLWKIENQLKVQVDYMRLFK